MAVAESERVDVCGYVVCRWMSVANAKLRHASSLVLWSDYLRLGRPVSECLICWNSAQRGDKNK